MASTLYIQLPPRAVADTLGAWGDQTFSYCLASAEKNILQQGRHAFSTLQELSKDAAEVVLLVSASDVSFLKVSVPPMPFVKIKAALPNLLEEQLLADPADLLFVATPPVNGFCAVAVVVRAWMEQVLGLGTQLGAGRISAFAVSSSMTHQAEISTVLIESIAADYRMFEVAVKNADQSTSGLSIDAQGMELNNPLLIQQIHNAVEILAPHEKLLFLVEPALEPLLREFAVAKDRQVQFAVLDWKTKITGISNQTLDLFSSLNLEGKHSFDWYKWRWTMSLLAAMLLISLFALNWKWWSLRREANTIRDSIQATYQNSFPREPISRDPLFQMQQKINAAKKLAGQSSNDDFLVLSGQFAQAWDQFVPSQGVASVANIEYRERSLFVTPKNLAEVPIEPLRAALKERSLKLDVKDGLLKISVEVGGV
ncbi:type II secretion system protein GspL [Undibacterium sp.]|uniref:type II secretion system protein GspL n=1 Tax=Undibacterium sp. TaxID=1914977 RepID=UPI00375011EC